ncbi:MAG: putative cell division-related protein [Pseudonocardiales bacterium]|nr:putative cell division-related protein [Pseudonocardiales bacterium]
MRIDLTVRDQDGLDRDVAVTAPEGAVFGDVVSELADLCAAPAGATWWLGAQQLTNLTTLAASTLRSGAIVSIGTHSRGAATRDPALRLLVVSGPDSGQIIGLPRGIAVVGRAPDCDLVLTDPGVSRRQASITVTTGGIRLHDLESTNGTTLDARTVDSDGSSVHPGEMIRMGDSLLTLAAVEDPPAALRPGPDATLLLNRPPRLTPSPPGRTVELPVRPNGGPAQRVQWIAALIPAFAGVGLALVLHSLQFLAFLLLSPLVILATALGDRVHWRRSRRRDAATFAGRLAAASAEIASGLRAEARDRRAAAPDPATLWCVATAHGARLWERRRSDPDLLLVRLGVTDAPSVLRARCGSAVSAAGLVVDVPSTVDLRAGPVGIAAPRGIALGVARWLVGQLAVLHSPADVEIVLMLSDGRQEPWAWARWLPHVRGRVAANADDRLRVVTELTELVQRRLARRRTDRATWPGSWLVLVVDEAAELSGLPGLAELLQTGHHAGVTAVCLDHRAQRLPTGSAATAEGCGETGTRLLVRRAGAVDLDEPIAERVSVRWADAVARALCPVLDASGDSQAGVPEQCRLLDLLGLGEPSVPALHRRWASSDGSLTTVVGANGTGPVVLDLVADGPHSLVAGTTGSGKSELLQTLVAGLAATHPPSAVTFLLVDYKGGAAFADCGRLPHVVGLVTDLDARLTARALQSLECELQRREGLFAAVGAMDLDSYRAARATPQPLPRLVIVVDEFAALAEELPEFVTGLVGTAQRGRSLGVHLVLATQRPGGVVSPEIRANATLRIALRMSDPGESLDVIGSDVAAAIDRRRPGRAYIGGGRTLVQLQAARVGGPAPMIGAEPAAQVTPLDAWRRLGSVGGTTSSGTTDLRLLVDAVREATAAAGVPAANQPWLPPLPTRLATRALPPNARPTRVNFGLADLPTRQRQPPVWVDLDDGGSVLFIGAARSGRTSALLSVAVAAASSLAPSELHVHGIDCAGGGLGVLADLPHAGTLASGDDVEVIAALVRRLDSEVARRRARLAELNVSSVADARGAGEPMPALLVLLDGWEAFAAAVEEHDGGQSIEVVVGLLRSGASVGLTLVVGGDRSALAPRLASAIATKYLLRLADKADYALAGLPTRAVPETMAPGRAIRAGDAAEVQVAFAGAQPSVSGRTAAVADTAALWTDPGATYRPAAELIRLRPLPVRIRLADLPAKAGLIRLGVGGDEANPLSVDLFAGAGRLLVAGPPRSGRSTLLRLLLAEALDSAVTVVVAAPRRSPLVAVASQRHIAVITPDMPHDRATELTRPGRLLLLVDDSDTFIDTPTGEALTAAVRAARESISVVAAGGSDELALTYRGIAADVRRSRCALLLQPTPVDGELVGLRLPRRRPKPVPGRGLLVGDPDWGAQFTEGPIRIQVALP